MLKNSIKPLSFFVILKILGIEDTISWVLHDFSLENWLISILVSLYKWICGSILQKLQKQRRKFLDQILFYQMPIFYDTLLIIKGTFVNWWWHLFYGRSLQIYFNDINCIKVLIHSRIPFFYTKHTCCLLDILYASIDICV